MFYPELNYPAILTATIVFFAIGGFWYSPFVLGKPWQKLKGYSQQDLSNAGWAMVFSFLISLICSWLIYLLIGFTGSRTFGEGFLMGIMAGLLVLTLGANNLLYTSKDKGLDQVKLFFIDQGYNLIGLGVVGGIVAIWR
jgi:hypothetical protein